MSATELDDLKKTTCYDQSMLKNNLQALEPYASPAEVKGLAQKVPLLLLAADCGAWLDFFIELGFEKSQIKHLISQVTVM